MLHRIRPFASFSLTVLAFGCQPFPELPAIDTEASTAGTDTAATGGETDSLGSTVTGSVTTTSSSSSETGGEAPEAGGEAPETGAANESTTSVAASSEGAETRTSVAEAGMTSEGATSEGASTSLDSGTNLSVAETQTSGGEATSSASTESSTSPPGGEDATTSESEGGETSPCTDEDVLCDPSGRMRCEEGRWVSDPCPQDAPACQDGACVLRGPVMVDVGDFLIDATEVTAAHYLAFLEARGDDVSGQPPECSWNTEYWDASNSMNPDDSPVTYVDWCDARAYCAWAGKRLCGRIGGGSIDTVSALDENQSQWFRACGGPLGAGRPNPAAECNDDGNISAVGSYAECEGYPTGVFDMVGNVEEWIDGCDDDSGADGTCYVVGGSYLEYSWCDRLPYGARRDRRVRPFGFRCCGE